MASSTSSPPIASILQPPPPTQHFNASMAIIIVVLVSALFFVGFFSVYIRKCTRGGGESRNLNLGIPEYDEPVHFHDRPGQGLDKSLVEALPVVSYSVVKNLKEGEGFECAVCLEKMEEDETLRLLPKCSHVFHSACIDVWFHSHSTCPLCRASLLPTFSELKEGVPAVGDVSRRILEAQEEAFGSAREVADGESAGQGSQRFAEASSSEAGHNIGRAGERNNARLALSRNSGSFRQAARRVEMRERLAAFSARYPSTSSNVDKSPRRTSSLSCVNFSIQRAGSPNSSGAKEFHNNEMFPFGSQRYGVSGVGLDFGPHSSNSLHRTGSTLGYDLQRLEDSNKYVEKHSLENGFSSSRNGEQWASIDLNSSSFLDVLNVLPSRVKHLDLGQVTITSTVKPRPRSGPIDGKSSIPTAEKIEGGERWARSERWSFSGLRGSFSLHRSSSDGRAQMLASGQLPAETGAVVSPVTIMPDVEANRSGDSSAGSQSFARRTLQWLAGGHYKGSSSAPVAIGHESGLQRIDTQ